MSIVRINAITVPDGAGDELLARFQGRVGEVEHMDGFERFEVLRPTDGNTWYVYTRWVSEEAFLAWVHSPAFARGHTEANEHPVANEAELLAFDVVLEAGAPAATTDEISEEVGS